MNENGAQRDLWLEEMCRKHSEHISNEDDVQQNLRVGNKQQTHLHQIISKICG